MAGVPPIPAVPAAGQQASDELIYAAVDARAKREHLRGHTRVADKRQSGADEKQVFKIIATAALPNVVNQNALLEQLVEQGQQVLQGQQALQQEQQALKACFKNKRMRRFNQRNMMYPGHEALLQPLQREEVAADGDYGPGELPPPGWFPATAVALNDLTVGQLDNLELFYGRQFAGNSVVFRRKSFQDFVCD